MINNFSSITFGTWGLSEWKDYSLEYCKNLCAEAYEKGIRSFDTAPVYGKGKGEVILDNLPEDCFIATKIPAKTKNKALPDAYPVSWMIKSIDSSRKRLKRDSLDLVQLHNWNYNWRMDLKLEKAMDKLTGQGIVSNWGISLPFEGFGEDTSIPYSPFNFFQVHYNLLQKQNSSLINQLKKNDQRVFLRSILLHGFLLNSSNPPFQKRYSSQNEALISKRDTITEDLSLEKKLGSCLKEGISTGADSIIVGITKPSQISALERYL